MISARNYAFHDDAWWNIITGIAFFNQQEVILENLHHWIRLLRFHLSTASCLAHFLGHILPTPNPVGQMRMWSAITTHHLNIPIGFDSSMSTARAFRGMALGCCRDWIHLSTWRLAQELAAGAIVNGQILHRPASTPENGTQSPSPWPRSFFWWDMSHFMGIASKAGLRAPAGKTLGPTRETLPPEHPAWDLEAEYIAYGASYVILFTTAHSFSAHGVGQLPHLLPRVQQRTRAPH